MAILLQIDFKFPAEAMGADLAAGAKDLAESITREPGFIAKIWTESQEAGEAGGIYLFDTKENAQAYATMHSARVAQMGAADIRAKFFEINEELTKITKGDLVFG